MISTTPTQEQFIHLLKRFNRKERYWLLREALGGGADQLSTYFLGKFEPAELRPSSSAWWAMDYHFDWMIAALWQAGRQTGLLEDASKADFARTIRGNQEDVDLIVAEGHRVWLCEAKFGGTISTAQIDSKIIRLDSLKTLVERFGLGIEFLEVDVLPAGRQERRVDKSRLKKINIGLDVHVGSEFLRVVRTDFDKKTCRDFKIESFKV